MADNEMQAKPLISERAVIYVLAALLLVSGAYIFATGMAPGFGNTTSGNITKTVTNASQATTSTQDAKILKLKTTIEEYMKLQGGAVTLAYNGMEDKGDYLLVNFTDTTGQAFPPIAVSKDLEYMYGSAMKIDDFAAQIALAEQQTATQNATPTTPAAAVKSDKPTVELFVMSYCPYGTQMEKALIPAKELLGDKANISIKFVSYSMHGAKEIQENTRQYCIGQKEPQKYWGYLGCFLEDGNASRCMINQSINPTEISACMTDAYSTFGISDSSTSFPIYSAENTQYGVQGSPTLVINGAQSSASRSPEGVKEAICAAFNTAPAECSTALSATQASAGFGYGAGSGTSSGGCAS